jgi:predicted permease
MHSLLQDLRYGARVLLKNPGVSAVVVLSLTLGIAANTTVFSVVNALLLAPPPVERPDELWQIWRVDPQGRSAMQRYRVTTYPALMFLRDHQQSFRALGAMNVEPEAVTWNRDGEGVAVQCLTVSGNYFELCGVRPALGRMFSPDEDRTPGTHPVTVLSHAFWKTRLGGDPHAVGKTMTINGTALTVVGVAPAEFKGAISVIASEMWIPYAISPTVFRAADRIASHQRSDSVGLGRLKSGVTTAQAEAELNALMHRLEDAHPDNYKNAAAGLLPSLAVPKQAQGMIAGFTAILMAAVFLVLMIACANAANLLLARATARRSEMAMRSALGAGRGRLMRQLLTESVLLAGLGGAGGLLLTTWLTQFVVRLIPASLPMRLELTLDWRVFTFVAVVSLLTGVVFGFAPAWRSSRVDLTATLKSGGREGSARRSRLSAALVVAQMAVCLMLLIAGTLCFRSLAKARSLDPGFQIAGRVAADMNLNDYGYSGEQARTFYARLVERAAALPGVKSAAVANHLPLGTSNNTMTVSAEGQPLQPDEGGTAVESFVVASGYFTTTGARLIDGREFTPGDREGAPPVAVINETAARRFWPGASPIGRRLVVNPKTREAVEVVGLVQDGKYRTLGEEPRPAVFLSFHQRPTLRATLVVHVAGDAQATLAALRRTARELDARLALTRLSTLDQHLTFALFPVRTSALLLGVLGGVALLLAASGLFGVIAYSVAQRTREVGIRLALGARQGQVVRQIVGEGMRLAGLGVVFGLAGAWALTRLLGSVLFEVSVTDPLTFAAVPLLLAGISALACWIPARRAAKVDPMVALRYE